MEDWEVGIKEEVSRYKGPLEELLSKVGVSSL